MHRRQRLAAQIRRAVDGAAAADGAGVAVQQLLPAKLLGPLGAPDLGILDVGDGDQGAPGLQRAEVGVDGRGHGMHVFGVGDVDAEPQDDHVVEPEEHAVEGVGRPERKPRVVQSLADVPGDRRRERDLRGLDSHQVGDGAPDLPALQHRGDVRPLGQLVKEHQAPDEQQDDCRVPIAQIFQPLRLHAPAPNRGPNQDRQQDDGLNVQPPEEEFQASPGEDVCGDRGLDGV